MEARLVFALFLCSGIATADFPFISNSAPAGIKLGESAVLACNYSGIALQFGDLVHWLKDGIEMASMSTVTSTWQRAVTVTTDARMSIVNVSAVSASVGGTFTCVVQRSSCSSSQCSPLTASALLPVYGPPLAVSWREANHSTLVLIASQPRALIFDVYSLYNVSSSVSVMLGSRDITGEFVPAVIAGGADPVAYNVTFTSSAALSQSVDDGSSLSVTVAVPMYPPISSTVTAVVVALPNISCDTQIQVAAGDNVRINCTVHSKPPATMFNWSSVGWFITGNGTSVDGRLVANVQEISNGYYTAVLSIFNVSSSDFGSYSLDVMNGVGKSTEVVQVKRGTDMSTTSWTPHTGSCSRQHLQWAVTVTALAVFGFSKAL